MRRHIDLSLYLITRRGQLSLDALFRIVLAAVKGGVTAVQLREKESSKGEVMTLAHGLKKLLKPFNVPLLINDHIDVALAVQADGVHLGQNDLNAQQARSLLGKKALIGLSTGNREEVLAAADQEIDYLGFGPVFHTNSKLYHGMPRGLEALEEVCRFSPHPIVAVGGMHAANAQAACEKGAAGIAVVSSIFDAPSPEIAARTMRERMKA